VKVPRKQIAVDPDDGAGKTKDCSTCDGTGTVPAIIGAQMVPPLPPGSSCTTCNGTGKVPKK
jgi:DnaJ-class molecular chaperone